MSEELPEFFGVDFKDCLKYKGFDKDIRDYSNLQKWMIYKTYKNLDADIIVKKNKQLLGWEKYEYFDCIFSFGTYFGMICRLFHHEKQSADDVRRMESKKGFGIFDILEKDAVQKVIKEMDPDQCDNWLDKFESAFSEFAYKTHTIGNYMPCPDNKYNVTKGRMFPYNDRIELLYSDNDHPSEQLSYYKKWIDKKEKENVLYITPILESTELKKLLSQKKWIFNSEDILKLVEWMEKVNQLIDERTEELRIAYLKKQ